MSPLETLWALWEYFAEFDLLMSVFVPIISDPSIALSKCQMQQLGSLADFEFCYSGHANVTPVL